jgi:hypothetical protein
VALPARESAGGNAANGSRVAPSVRKALVQIARLRGVDYEMGRR